MSDEDTNTGALFELGDATALTLGSFFPSRVEALVIRDHWDPM